MNVQIKIRSGASWVALHPKTNLDQLSDITATGKAIAKLANPTSHHSFISVSTTGVASYRTVSEVLSDIGASPSTHGHVITGIQGLTAALAEKADLVDGKISSSQIPAWLLGGLRFAAAISTDTLMLEAAWLSSQGITTSNFTAPGKYFICTAASGCVVTVGSNVVVITGDENINTGSIKLEQGDWIFYRGFS